MLYTKISLWPNDIEETQVSVETEEMDGFDDLLISITLKDSSDDADIDVVLVFDGGIDAWRSFVARTGSQILEAIRDSAASS